jgi:peptidoglycan hydrolase-like protein with peptidoglycan-binding domain
MQKTVFIISVLVLSISMVGCGNKQQASLEEPGEKMSMEALGTFGTNTTAVSGPKAQMTPATPVTQTKLEPLPPPGPYKPKVKEIQTALKNAGYYAGAIDGAVGPQTKKAIEGFQKANGLQVDGKVGPKTWAVLSAHLNPAPTADPAPADETKTKKR